MNKKKITYYLLGGTTTINILLEDKIIIASDGLQTQMNENGITGYNEFDKIRNYENIFYSFTGDIISISNEKKEVVFNAYEIMDQILEEYKDFDIAFEKFNIIALERLKTIFNQMPEALLNHLKSKINQKLIEAVMVTFKNGVPTLKNWDFGFINKNGDVEFVMVDKPFTGKFPFLFFTGHSQAIKKETSNPDYWGDGSDIIEKIFHLFKVQINATPETVGYPVDVVTIVNEKHERVKREA